MKRDAATLNISVMFLLQNYPLYIRSVPTQSELKFHYTVHTSLDVVEEKISTAGKAMAEQRELYLGLLYPTEDYKVYPLHRSFSCNGFSSLFIS